MDVSHIKPAGETNKNKGGQSKEHRKTTKSPSSIAYLLCHHEVTTSAKCLFFGERFRYDGVYSKYFKYLQLKVDIGLVR